MIPLAIPLAIIIGRGEAIAIKLVQNRSWRTCPPQYVIDDAEIAIYTAAKITFVKWTASKTSVFLCVKKTGLQISNKSPKSEVLGRAK